MDTPVGWGCRIRQLPMCSRVKPLPNKATYWPWVTTLNAWKGGPGGWVIRNPANTMDSKWTCTKRNYMTRYNSFGNLELLLWNLFISLFSHEKNLSLHRFLYFYQKKMSVGLRILCMHPLPRGKTCHPLQKKSTTGMKLNCIQYWNASWALVMWYTPSYTLLQVPL